MQQCVKNSYLSKMNEGRADVRQSNDTRPRKKQTNKKNTYNPLHNIYALKDDDVRYSGLYRCNTHFLVRTQLTLNNTKPRPFSNRTPSRF